MSTTASNANNSNGHGHWYPQGRTGEGDSFIGAGLDANSDSSRPALSELQLLDLDLPQSELDLTMSFNSIFATNVDQDVAKPEQKVQKRASNVLKLSQENESLKEQLRAMTERIEAAERKQRELEGHKNRPARTAA